ncbi:MAG: hypothetical protein JWN76_3014 [Chitinophagaceae bacterium]|nr:hypothetical protein [Chitinophagaceae bacterium]
MRKYLFIFLLGLANLQFISLKNDGRIVPAAVYCPFKISAYSIKDNSHNPVVKKAVADFINSLKRLNALQQPGFEYAINLHVRYEKIEDEAKPGARVEPNYNSQNFEITLNADYENATSLALYATLIHEYMHCILMSLYQYALNNDHFAIDYIDKLSLNFYHNKDNNANSFLILMNQNNPGQHELMALKFLPAMSEMLFQLIAGTNNIKSQEKFIRRYCTDLVWAGL